MTKKLHRFTIDRKKWINGSNSEYFQKGEVMLRNEKGNMCCLGFFAKSCGFHARSLTGMYEPGDLFNEESYKSTHSFNGVSDSVSRKMKRNAKKAEGTPIKELLTVTGKNNTRCSSLMKVNDDTFISNKKREKIITKKFREIGVIVEFEGKHDQEC